MSTALIIVSTVIATVLVMGVGLIATALHFLKLWADDGTRRFSK